MKNIRKSVCLVSVAMLILVFFLGALTIAPVAATAVLDTPINKTIETKAGDTFVLPFKMEFDAGDKGYFDSVIFWDNNESAANAELYNFTYVGYSVSSGVFSQPISAAIKKAIPYGYAAGYYRYTVAINESYGEDNNAIFWLNLTMGAYGVKGGVSYPHAVGYYNITIVKARCYESLTLSEGPGDVRINVTGVHDVAVTNVKAICPKEGLDPVTQGYRSWTVNVNVTVKNNGDFTESFTVYAYRGGTLIGSAAVTNLASKAETNKTIAWNLAGLPQCTSYVISANTSVVVGDINPGDNSKTDGTMKVKHDGDASNDNFVDVDDLQILGWSWQKGKGDTGYNPQADFSFDAFVDVDDLQILGWNWQTGC